jgi:hypothetical protein
MTVQPLPVRTGLKAGEEEPFEDSGPRSGPPDALVLDIGDGVGALIIYADEACLGSEIDLTPAGSPQSHQIHTMVRRRRATNRDVIAGLFPELAEGTYTVWALSGNGPIGEVTIVGGQISEFHGGDCGADRTLGQVIVGPHSHHGSHAHSHA